MRHNLNRFPSTALATVLAVLVVAVSALQPDSTRAAAQTPAYAVATSQYLAGTSQTASTSPTDTSGLDTTLLGDETSLLGNTNPELSTGLPLAKLPPIKGSVAALETQVISLLGRVQSSSLPTATQTKLVNALQNLSLRLTPALDVQDQVDHLRGQENLLLQARVDGQAAIDRLSAQVQANLDRLRVSVQSTVSADVVASVGSMTITVSGGADTIQAQLGAKVNRLLVDVLADLDVLHIATLHATAHIDTARLNVNLYALVKKLRLDLNLLLTNLKVSVRADVAAAITAEASLTASLAAEIDGLKADLALNVNTKLSGLDTQLVSLINGLNGSLASASGTLQQIQAQAR